jgi:photosystem II stability/assembly factor-like uncharacterized protein
LPNTGSTIPKDLLAICTGDLDFTVAATNPRCYYWSNGVDSLVVSFINVTEWQQVTNPNLKHTFQVVLNKADTSITYQYGVQQGRYNATNNTYLCIGWQNQTGQIGLSYTYSTAPPHALMPDSGLAIKIKRTTNTGLIVTDGGIVGGFNAGNLAAMFRTGAADTVKAVVKNFGTAPISNVPVRYTITRSGQPTAYDTVIVPSLTSGQQVTVVFPRLFTPAVAGTYSARFDMTVAGDIGPGNNTKTAELASASFGLNQTTRILYENGTLSGSIGWLGGGGFGVAMDLPAQVYPVRVESVFVQVGTITAQPMTVQILDGSSGVPGAVLATRSVTAVASSMNIVDFRSDSVRVTGGRFFVGATGNMNFFYETTLPISLRTWEFTNGWSPYRSGDVQDMIIRASVRQLQPVTYGWATQTSGTTQALRCVKTLSRLNGWIGGAGGTVLRTTDGGTTWSSVGGGPMGTNTVYAIEALSPTTAFTTTSPTGWTYIFRTTNAGATWDTVFSQANGFIDAIKMFDANNGIAIGDAVGGVWAVLRTTNGGTTWTQSPTAPPQVGTETGFNTSFSNIGTSHLWFGTNNSRIYRSTNGGATWSSGTTSFVSSVGVGFTDTQVGVAGGSGTTGAARSTDGGATWTTATLPGSGSIYGISAKGTSFWAVRGTIVCRSTTQGATWDTAYAGTIGTFRHLDLGWEGTIPYGWAVTSTGGIARYGVITTGIEEDDPMALPQEFALMQNYPNPFNPATNIRYALARSAHVSLRVYNLLGQEIAILKNEVEATGTHDVVWYGKNNAGQVVASGVYFYSMEAKPLDGSSTIIASRKMLLVK